MADPEVQQRRGRGRPAVSTREDIERVAMGLFLEHGYQATTIQRIADACGVSRTSVFRYWGSKAEIVWAVFDVHTKRLGALLRADKSPDPTMMIVRRAVVQNMRMSTVDSALWMERFAVLDSTPELRTEESAHWIGWAGTVARYIAERSDLPESAALPQSAGGALQAAFLAVLRQWLADDDPSPDVLMPQLDEALKPLCSLLQHWLDEPDFYR